MTGAGVTTWPRFVVGFAVLYAVLAFTSGLDGTGRSGRSRCYWWPSASSSRSHDR
jgi:hypothetical protein